MKMLLYLNILKLQMFIEEVLKLCINIGVIATKRTNDVIRINYSVDKIISTFILILLKICYIIYRTDIY